MGSTTNPTLLALRGDFHSSIAPRTTMHAAMSLRGSLGHAQRLLPDSTPTHFSKRGSVLTAMTIDHVSAEEAVPEAEAAVFLIEAPTWASWLPSTLDRQRLPVQEEAISLEGVAAGGCGSRGGAAGCLLDLDLDVALTPVALDIIISAAHAVADRVIPRPKQPHSEIASLAPHTPLYSQDEINARQAQVWKQARKRGCRFKADTLRTAAITRATPWALRLPTVPLQPIADLARSPNEQPITRGARLPEVNAQAAYVQKDRWVWVDVRTVNDAAPWEPWFTAFRPEHNIPMHLVRMLVRETQPHVVSGRHSNVHPGALPTSSPRLAWPHRPSLQGLLPGDGTKQPASAPFCPFVGLPVSRCPGGLRKGPEWALRPWPTISCSTSCTRAHAPATSKSTSAGFPSAPP